MAPRPASILDHTGDHYRGEANSVGHLQGLWSSAAEHVNPFAGPQALGRAVVSVCTGAGEVDVDLPFWAAGLRGCMQELLICAASMHIHQQHLGDLRAGQICPWLSLVVVTLKAGENKQVKRQAQGPPVSWHPAWHVTSDSQSRQT